MNAPAAPPSKPKPRRRKDPHDPTRPFTNEKREMFAQAVARGMTPVQAGVIAGYSKWRRCSYRAWANADMKARVAELIYRRARGGSNDLAHVIDELIRLVAAAEALNTAPALREARAMLAEAGKLKGRLPETPILAPPLAALPAPAWPTDDDGVVLEFGLSDEAWLAKYAPKR
jgi:hypothetical protein